MMRNALRSAAAALAGIVLAAAPALPFGGQNPAMLDGFPMPASGDSWHENHPKWPAYRDNWHHPAMSYDAARAAGFSKPAAASVAWHSDYIDSYLYNPIWWAGRPGPERLILSIATAPELAKLHFDDLVTTAEVRAAWQQLLGGTVAAMVWAKEKQDVAAAHNAVGVSLHAIQDFYSHSNWLDDPDRRALELGWLAFPAAERATKQVWTGWYEHQGHQGRKPHGKYGIACSGMSQVPIQGLLLPACLFTPLGDAGTCAIWRHCAGAASPNLKSHIYGVTLPPGVLYLEPAGINVDNTWLAEIGRQARGLTDISAGDLFAKAKERAQDTSQAWLETLGARLAAVPGGAAFWSQVKAQGTLEKKPPMAPFIGRHEKPFEELHLLPYTFLSAGPYPPRPDLADAFYLRVELETGEGLGAGTNADLFLRAKKANGGNPCADRNPCEFALDYGPVEEAPGLSSVQKDLLDFNDFEPGSKATYVVGPFSQLPAKIEIHNDAPSASDIAAQARTDLRNSVEDGIETAKNVLLNLIAGQADHVKTASIEIAAADLPGSGSVKPFTIRADGGVEGDYEVHGSVRNLGPKDGGTEYEVEWDELMCVEEAFTDQLPDPRDSSLDKSDEPFVFNMVVPFGSPAKTQRKGPFPNNHTGSRHSLGLSRKVVLPPHGSMNIVAQVWESDSEGPNERQELYDTFQAKIEEARQEARSHHDSVTMLAEAVAAEWVLKRIEVYAFRRGPSIATGKLLVETPSLWVRGGETASFSLNGSALATWPVAVASLDTIETGLAVAPVVAVPVATDGPPAAEKEDARAPVRKDASAGGPKRPAPTRLDAGSGRPGSPLPVRRDASLEGPRAPAPAAGRRDDARRLPAPGKGVGPAAAREAAKNAGSVGVARPPASGERNAPPPGRSGERRAPASEHVERAEAEPTPTPEPARRQPISRKPEVKR